MEDPRVGSRPWKLRCPLQILPSPLARQDKNSRPSIFRSMFSKKNMHCNENPICVFPEKEVRGLSPNFHIHMSVSGLYIYAARRQLYEYHGRKNHVKGFLKKSYFRGVFSVPVLPDLKLTWYCISLCVVRNIQYSRLYEIVTFFRLTIFYTQFWAEFLCPLPALILV